MTSSPNYVPDYEPLALRGSGSFGYVIEAYDNTHGIKVAIKRTHKVGTKLSREYEILSQIRECEYVVKLLDIFYTANEENKVIQNLVFEFVPRSLDKYIEDVKARKEYIPIEKIKRISSQLLLGLDFCHKKNIIHRDLKPENILFTQDEQVKICDFGSSKNINANGASTFSTPYIVSRYYRAPELLLGKYDYDSKIDIFATGCIIAELFMLNPIFPGLNEGLQILEYINILGLPKNYFFRNFNIPKNFLEFLENLKEVKIYPLEKIINPKSFYNEKDVKEATDLLYKMLRWDFKERYSAQDCLKHPFLEETVKECLKETNKEV